MLIYPTIKQAPLSGLSGYGGGSTGLNVHAASCTFEDGDAGLSGSGRFWRLGSETNPHLDQGSYNNDLDFDTFPGADNTHVFNTGPDCDMPPGMTNSLYIPNGANIYTNGDSNADSATWGTDSHFWAYIWPTAHNSMQMPCRQWKQGQDYELFVTDSYQDRCRFDWPTDTNYSGRNTENTSWGTANQDQMVLNTWNFIRFGRSQISGNWGVRFICYTWGNDTWTLKFSLEHPHSTGTLNNGNSAQFQIMKGITGYVGNCGFGTTACNEGTPASS